MSSVRVRPQRAQYGIAVALAVWFSGPALADDQPFSKWFKYGSDIETAWDVAGDAAKPLQVSIRRKGIEQRGAAKRVLVLYPRPSSAYDIAITKILQVFDSKEIDTEFTVINFEIKDDAGKEAIRFAETHKFDLIFSMGSESTAWMYDNYRGGALPVVSVCSKDPVQLGQMKDYEGGSGSNFAFTSLNVPVEIQMAYIKELMPELKNLAVLVDKKNISAVQTQAEPVAAAARQAGMQVIMAAVEELAQIVPRSVQTMRKNDPDLNKSIFLITGSTAVFREIRAINENADRVPVISMIPEIVTTGRDTAVLGIGISFESNAHMAAVYGADVLTGRAKPGDLKVGVVSPPDMAISFLKAREIGMRVPFSFFEAASFVYDYQGRAVRSTAHPISVQN
jgi:putative tryptophan/tyrosine transport system substrate-binding protein